MANFKIGTVDIFSLFNNINIEISIPDYQRPYVWTKEHINELLIDWNDHFFYETNFNDDAIKYFMGSIMIHNNNGVYEVIDGQQRLTTLLIMDYVWNKDYAVLNKGNFNFNYNSRISQDHIKVNRNLLESLRGGLIAQKFSSIIKKLVVSVIITDSEDDAFVFFESQNNRGVPLDEVDYFKSYHLRELNNHENYLRHFAKKFDQINALNNAKVKSKPNLLTLNKIFINQLWRSRFWSKNKLWFASRKSLLDTFQKNTVVFDEVDDIKLYPSFKNALGTSLKFNNLLQLELKSTIRLYGAESIDIPFTINQPIQKGIGFFLYTEKYSSIFNYLFRDEKLKDILPITKLVYDLYNEYFINLYQIAIVMYYDKFGTENIEAYSKWFEHFLGAFRMNRASIVEQSPIVLLRDYGNILQVIEQAYLVQEVLSTLKSFVPERYYEGFTYKEDMNGYVSIHLSDANQTKLSPARQNYYQKIRAFYAQQLNGTNDLTEKQNWINGSLTK